MSQAIIDTEKLTAIGEAIRAKTGKAEKLTADEMATEIAGITAGTDDKRSEIALLEGGALPETYMVPNGTKKLRSLIFNGVTGAKTLIIPESVTEIEKGVLDGEVPFESVIIQGAPVINWDGYDSKNIWTDAYMLEKEVKFTDYRAYVKAGIRWQTGDHFMNNPKNMKKIIVPAGWAPDSLQYIGAGGKLDEIYIFKPTIDDRPGYNVIGYRGTLLRYTDVKDVYVEWGKDEFGKNGPWGNDNCTIHYNTKFNDDGTIQEG